MGRIVIGTSSWADPGFVEEWYPPGLAARDRLAYYAERFDAVEVNATFYAVPDEKTVARWVEQTHDGFTFDVKLHKLLSRHSADLKSLPRELREDAEVRGRGRVVLTGELEARMAEATVEAVAPLARAGRLRTFLLQLSPVFEPRKHALEELAPLVHQLAETAPVAVELRHRAWVKGEALEETLGWFERARAAFVCVDAPQGTPPTMMPPVDAVTLPDVAYFRAHGRNAEGYARGRSVAERFAWDYADAELHELGQRVETLAEDAGEVRMMFNNNRGADAPNAAARMKELLGE